MKRTLFGCLFALWSCSCAWATPLVIDNDPGGDIDQEWLWVSRIELAGTPIRFRGECDSACTLLLSLPKSQMCAEPTALFGFHLATHEETGKPVDQGTMDRLSHRFYPPALRAWLSKQHLEASLTYLYAEDAIKLGVVNACPDRAAE